MPTDDEYGFGEELEQELLEAIDEVPPATSKAFLETGVTLATQTENGRLLPAYSDADVSVEAGTGREEVTPKIDEVLYGSKRSKCINKNIFDFRWNVRLAQLTEPLLFRIMCFLSPEDLCTLGRTSRVFKSVTDDSALWKRLYFARWPPSPGHEDPTDDDETDLSTWKALYMERDHQELTKSVQSAPAMLRPLYFQMATAKRSEPLGVSHMDQLYTETWDSHSGSSNLCKASREVNNKPWCSMSRTDKSRRLEAAIMDFRRHRGLLDSSMHREHCCSPGECCGFTHLEPFTVWVCNSTGYVHRCGLDCQARQLDADSHSWVCPISGRCWDRMLMEVDEEEQGQEQGGVEDARGEEEWQADEGMTGRLGRWFYAGYNAANEKDLLMCGIKLS